MMYSVKYFEFNEVELEQTLFQSNNEFECWNFVRNHLSNILTRKKAKSYMVCDSLNRFYDPPHEIYFLKKAA